MANNEILTDDCVASLLAKDAKESSIKYSAMRFEGFANSKPPTNKPKPNMRFLRNIIKDTDSHNAALLAREVAESRARLESLAGRPRREQKAKQVGGGDIRRKQLGDIAAILGGGPRKRRRVEGDGKPENKRRRRNASSEDDDPEGKPREDRARKQRSREEDEGRDDRSRDNRIKRHRNGDEEKDESRRPRSHKSHRHQINRIVLENREKDRDRIRRYRSISRSPREERTKEARRRDRSPKRKPSRSPELGQEKSHQSHRRRRSPSTERLSLKREDERSRKKSEPQPNYDSDPLDDIIGSRPPPAQEVRSRGRGTMSNTSGIDSRFSANYDPTVDVQLDPDEENDLDRALEALRDRQKWKQKGADRLRAAGFTNDEVEKWEKGGEKREEDVKWTKRGEGREWDRGKVIGVDGMVSFQPALGGLNENETFGRLKDA